MNYRNHTLVISKRDDSRYGWFTGTSNIGGKRWIHERFTEEELIELFNSDVDNYLLPKSPSKLDRLIELTEEAGLYEYW